MNYQWHYDNLIKTRKERTPVKGQYYERHHIIMRSMGGDNNPSNIVKLTAREHFLAHWLLWRIYENKEAAFAFHMMHLNGNKQRVIHSSRAYSEVRQKYISGCKERMENLNKNPEYRDKMLLTRRKNGRINGLKYGKENGTKNIKKLLSNPEFCKNRDTAAGKRMIQLHKEPEFCKNRDKRASNTFLKLNQNPEFREKAIKGKFYSMLDELMVLNTIPTYDLYLKHRNKRKGIPKNFKLYWNSFDEMLKSYFDNQNLKQKYNEKTPE